MNLQLIKASAQQKVVIKNLMQLYMYDFSEFVQSDVEEDGSFAAYSDLDDYWKEDNNRFPYILQKDEKYVGFVLIR